MDTNFNNYTSFTLNDLLNDDKFIALVNKRRSNPFLLKEWEEVLSKNPIAGRTFEEAASIIDVAAGKSIRIDSSNREDGWKKIMGAINEPVVSTSFNWWRVAAIVILFLSIAGVGFWSIEKSNKIVKWETAVEQFKVVNLPDHSVVTLGANSSLSYKGKWEENSNREVWVTGEAHFEVNHLNKDTSRIKRGERFIVHVGDEMEVEVLGTVFNVRHTSGKTTVELESGSVKIAFKNNNKEDYVLLKPGEKAELNLLTNTLTRMKFIEQYPSGVVQEKTIELNNTSVKEIIQLVEKTYNKKIEVYDSSILNRRLDGSFPIYSEKDVWFILSNILDIDVEIKSDDVLVFKPR